MEFDNLIETIKKKKELSSLPDEFVLKHVESYFKKNPGAEKLLSKPKSQKYKQIVKDIRADLRRVYGLFRVKEEIELKGISQKEIEAILLKHSSTKERILYYKEIYSKLITKDVKTILDLGCGLNPLSLIYSKNKNLEYYAYDISESEIKVLNNFFKKFTKKYSGFTGKAEILDLFDILKVKKLPKADVAFFFKMTDVLDKGKGHKKTEEILKAITAKKIVVSFPTVTMSNKRMRFPRRKWIELLCERLGFGFEYFEVENEIFYVVEK